MIDSSIRDFPPLRRLKRALGAGIRRNGRVSFEKQQSDQLLADIAACVIDLQEQLDEVGSHIRSMRSAR